MLILNLITWWNPWNVIYIYMYVSNFLFLESQGNYGKKHSFHGSLPIQTHACRSSRSTLKSKKPDVTAPTEPLKLTPFLPPPPTTMNPIYKVSNTVDYLSGDGYKFEGSSDLSSPNPNRSSISSAPPPKPATTTAPSFTNPFSFDEPNPLPKSAEEKPPNNAWENPFAVSDPPPLQSGNNRGKQILEQQETFHGSNSNSNFGSDFSNDILVNQTRNLSLQSGPAKQLSEEDKLFKDLLDFSKTKSAGKPNRPF